MKKLIRITTVPSSLRTLLKGQLRFMGQHFETLGVSSKGEPLNEVERNEGVITFGIDMSRTITPLKDLKATFLLYKLFKKEKPFIVHTHTPKAGTLGMLAAKIAGVPHRLHTIAGLPLLETKGFKRSLLNRVEKITYRNATLVLPNSYGLKKIVLDQKFTVKSKLKIIGNGSSNGIDTNHFNIANVSSDTMESLKNQLKISKEDFVFIFVGRIVKDKGINELIEVFNILEAKQKNCKLILVGPKENKLDPISNRSQEIINSNQNILNVGVQKDIRPYVAISNILVFPSYREGFPNVVMQASAMEKPCIVSDINGCNEIIENGFNGLIVQPKNSNDLINAMIYSIKNPSELKLMSENARDNIVKKYQQEYIWNELLKLYKSLE